MNAQEFNEKYKDYLAKGFYGLAIHDEEVISFLDTIFPTLIEKDNFMYHQIKLKFCLSRVYMVGVSKEIESFIEKTINNILIKNE